jgi:hypothetical protein
VVTSDHGEFLGENGNFDHHPGSKNPLLLEVPWLKVENAKNVGTTLSYACSTEPVAEDYRTVLKEKLRRLKKSGKI